MNVSHRNYYEDFEVGDRFGTMGRTISESEIVSFVILGGLFDELFINQEYVRNETDFGGRFAPGALTYTFAEGLLTQTRLFDKTAIAFLGMTEMRVLAPTRVNDTIHVETEVSEKRLTSSGNRGVLTLIHTVRNQNGEAVMTYTTKRMIRCRE